MQTIEKLIQDEIVAILPIYAAMKGNSTRIITKKSQDNYIYKSIKTVLAMVAGYFTIDLKAVRKYYGGFIGASNSVPIPFNTDNIFIPVKTRRPIGRNDGSYGYVNLRFVKGIKEEGQSTYILIEGGMRLGCIQRGKTLKRHITHGNIISRIYDGRVKTVVMEEKENFYTDYLKPATKGDIAIIRDELLAIKKKMI